MPYSNFHTLNHEHWSYFPSILLSVHKICIITVMLFWLHCTFLKQAFKENKLSWSQNWIKQWQKYEYFSWKAKNIMNANSYLLQTSYIFQFWWEKYKILELMLSFSQWISWINQLSLSLLNIHCKVLVAGNLCIQAQK